jgi:AAA domain-containing protein
MPDRSAFLERRPALTLNISGFFGTGKTLQSLSFPKCYVVSCDPAGLETIRQPANAKFLANLVFYEELHNESREELKELFRETATSNERGSIYGCLAHVRELAAKGEVQTLVIDGFTYLADMKWRAINEYEIAKSQTTGNVDSQAMYRNLGLYLHRFVASNLMTMATREKLNVILTTHLKRESEETVHGNEKLKNRARKVMTNSDIAPMIEGGFRNKLSGLVGGDLYLEKSLKDGKIVYEAICDIARGLGTVVLAKNRFGLPPRLDLMNRSLYEAITDALKLKREQAGQAKPTTAGA